MKIKQIIGREIFDSRGLPCIECELILEYNSDEFLSVTASVPSGSSTGKHEAFELRDNKKRLGGKGVLKAINNIEDIIAPTIIGKEPDVVSMDIKMTQLDGTNNKSKLGANAILAVSIAILKAQAMANEMEIYEMLSALCNLDAISIPIPLFNLINGGMHANNNLDIQEFMIIPTGQSTFRSAMESVAELFYKLKSILQEKKLGTCIGYEGGFAPNINNEKQALDLLMLAIEKTSNIDNEFVIAMDVASSRLYDPKTKKYTISGKSYSSDKLIKFYEELISSYPIICIEDPFAEDDWNGWKTFSAEFSQKIQIVGDDLFATNPARILKGAKEKAANAAIIKPNQIGTVTETLQSIIACNENGLNAIISHRSGETNDSFIADLAIGTQTSQIKAGGITGGARLAKYNRLLRIEDRLTMEIMK